MINSTSYGVDNAGQSSAFNTVSLKTICNNLMNTRATRLLFAALLLLMCSASNKTFAFGTTYYYPTSATAGTGGTYCIGSTAAGITGNIFTGSATATGGTSSTVTWQWYYNTTGATGTIAGATAVGTASTYTAGAASVAANLPGASISTAVGGIYYYFLYVSYTGGTATPGVVYSNLSTVIIGAGAITGSPTTCVGSSTALSDLVPGGTWSSSNPGIASISVGGAVTGVTQGTATITYTGSSGCTTTRTQTVNALAAPISGTPQACPGTTTSLSDAANGGTWTSGTAGTATIDPAGLVTGITAGTTIITYDNGCGTPANLVVTIYPFPGAIIGPNNVCADSATIVMSNDSSGGFWTSSNLPVATAITTSTTTGLITGLTGGTSMISYTRFGCTVSTQITVTSLPAAIAGSLKQCTGTTITLSDSLAGGIWTSFTVPVASIDPVTGVVTGAAAGTTTITYTTTCGFVTAVDTTVGIPDPIQGKDSTCVGSNTVFADVVLGGVWTSSDTTKAKVLSGSGIVSGIAAGTAMITYTVPPGCFITRRVTVNALPPAIGGPTPMKVCPGANITLTNGLPGTWSSLRSFVASVATNTGVVTGVTTDTATIVFTSNKGCNAYTVVTVNPAPLPISGGINASCGQTIDTVYDATPGGVWSNSPTSVATIGTATGIITTISGGTTVISYTIPSTTCFATKVYTVTPAPVPVVTYNNGTVTFYTDNYYTSYQWYDSAQGLIPGAVSFQTAALYTGNYWVVVTDSNGCVGASVPFHFNVNNVGVSNLANDDIRVYPNPASGVVFIESAVRVRAVITGIDGKTEMEQADAKQMNIGGLASGMYFISLYNEGGERVRVQKLIKQ